MAQQTDDEDDFAVPPEALALRNISINPQPGPIIDFLLVVGIQQPGAPQVCERFANDFGLCHLDVLQYLKDLSNTNRHPSVAYGHLHPAAYVEKFFKRLSSSKFLQSEAFAFFMLPILRYKIAQEIANGRKAFVISGLENLLRAAREFTLKIAKPVAVICFRDTGSSALKARSVMEQLFSNDDLIDVPVGGSVDATYRRLLAETVGKHGMPSSPPYSPSP